MEIYTSLILQDSVCCSSLATSLLAGGIRHLSRVQAAGTKFKSSPSFSRRGSSFLQMGSSQKHQFSISRDPSVIAPMAIGSNSNVDTDDMFDDLFKKYGKVVFRRNDRKPAASEIDDDAESLSFAVAAAKVASEVKAADIRVLFVKPLVYWTRFFIIATAFSRPQIDAIGYLLFLVLHRLVSFKELIICHIIFLDFLQERLQRLYMHFNSSTSSCRTKIRDMAEKQYGKVASGDSKPNSWTLLDFGDVVVHIFLPQQRAFYNLEEFYGNATSIELPFENQQQFRN